MSMLVSEMQGRQRRVLSVLRADPRQAICEDAIICLICGRALRQLTNTHLASHETTAVAYKRRFGYNRRRSLMALSLRRVYSERAVQSRLATLIRRRPIVSEPELRRRGGARPIALEEYLTRREAQLRAQRPAPGAALRVAAPEGVLAWPRLSEVPRGSGAQISMIRRGPVPGEARR